MDAFKLHEILHNQVQPGTELNNSVKSNVDTDFKKVKTPIDQNISINMQSLDKIPAQESFSDKFNKILEKIPWKDLMFWTAIVGCIYFLGKIPPKNNSRRERRF